MASRAAAWSGTVPARRHPGCRRTASSGVGRAAAARIAATPRRPRRTPPDRRSPARTERPCRGPRRSRSSAATSTMPPRPRGTSRGERPDRPGDRHRPRGRGTDDRLAGHGAGAQVALDLEPLAVQDLPFLVRDLDRGQDLRRSPRTRVAAASSNGGGVSGSVDARRRASAVEPVLDRLRLGASRSGGPPTWSVGWPSRPGRAPRTPACPRSSRSHRVDQDVEAVPVGAGSCDPGRGHRAPRAGDGSQPPWPAST